MFSQASVSHFVHNQPHGYPVTAHPCYGAVATHPTRMLFLLPPATKLGQGNIFTGICDSVHRGVCLNACWDTTHPPGQDPPLDQAGTPQDQAGTPQDQAGIPPEQRILGDTVNERAVCILLECNLLSTFYHKSLCFCWLKQSWYLMGNGWRTISSHWLYNYLWHLVLIKFSSLTVSDILNIDGNLCYLII